MAYSAVDYLLLPERLERRKSCPLKAFNVQSAGSKPGPKSRVVKFDLGGFFWTAYACLFRYGLYPVDSGSCFCIKIRLIHQCGSQVDILTVGYMPLILPCG